MYKRRSHEGAERLRMLVGKMGGTQRSATMKRGVVYKKKEYEVVERTYLPDYPTVLKITCG